MYCKFRKEVWAKMLKLGNVSIPWCLNYGANQDLLGHGCGQRGAQSVLGELGHKRPGKKSRALTLTGMISCFLTKHTTWLGLRLSPYKVTTKVCHSLVFRTASVITWPHPPPWFSELLRQSSGMLTKLSWCLLRRSQQRTVETPQGNEHCTTHCFPSPVLFSS